MPEETGEWKDGVVIHFQQSLVEGMLKMADELLSLAAERTNHEKALAACATMILAVALEQGVMNTLQFKAKTYAYHNNVDITETPYEALLKEDTSLRKRMVELPKVLSDGNYQLDPASPYFQRLHDLISRRNELLHIQDEVHVIKPSPADVIIEEDGSTRVSFPPPKLPEFAWDKITVEQARGFQEAVGAYFEEVLDTNPDELSSGKIICKVPERRMGG